MTQHFRFAVAHTPIPDPVVSCNIYFTRSSRKALRSKPLTRLLTASFAALIAHTRMASLVRVPRIVVESFSNSICILFHTSGHIYWSQGELLDASINRSPTGYLNNSETERGRYAHDTDKDMYLLKFTDVNEKPLGVLNWFAVHPTSMNNTNSLISGDNKGQASLMFEAHVNENALPGRGAFVAGFANANLGDVSPNIMGPRCQDTGEACDFAESTCGGKTEMCYASGPGRDMVRV